MTGPKPAKAPRAPLLIERGKARRIWCAYEPDGSEYVLFGTEVDALRYATRHRMECRSVGFGVPLREQIKRPLDD